MPALLERPKLSKEMAAALKHHILKERDRKRQEEEEADKAINRKKEEQERLRKKAEAESLSLEETREQIKSLEEKLKNLQTEKHELFLQLKKVLNEDENRRRQQMKEKNDIHVLAAMGHQYHPAMHIAGPHMIVPASHLTQQRPQLMGDKSHMYRAQQQASPPVHSGINKRARSPSPPVVQLYPQTPVHNTHYPQGPYGQPQTTHSPYRQPTHPHYTTAQTAASSTYPVNQSGYPVHYPTGQGNPSKYQARADSAFSSYPAQQYVAAAQQKASEQYSQSFQVQQQRKLSYMQGTQSTSGLSVQPPQQVEQSTSKGGYAEDGHYQHKLQGQHVRSMSSSHAQALHAQQQAHQPLLTQSQVHLQSQSKPSLLQTYPQRRKPETSMYQPHNKKPTAQQHQQPPQQHGASYPSTQQPRTSTYPTQSQHQQYRY